MKYPAKIFFIKTGKERFWITPALVLVVFLAVLMGLEALIITIRITGYHPVENYGTGNKYLEHKIAQLERFVSENGKVEYMLVGNSKAGEAVDIRIAGMKYQEITGEPLSCFNFGFAGNTSEFLPVIFKILKEDYAPEKFIFDVSGPYQRNNVQQQNSRWLRYRSGDFNISGWMVEKFHFMRVFLGLRYWMEQPGEYRQLADAPGKLMRKDILLKKDEYNYSNMNLQGTGNAEIKVREISAARLRRSARVFAAEDSVFPQVIEIAGTNKIIFVKIPVSSRVRVGMVDFQERSQRAADLALEYGIPLMQISDPDVLSDGNWKNDGVHMLGSGRWIFSEWFGEALAGQEGFSSAEVLNNQGEETQ